MVSSGGDVERENLMYDQKSRERVKKWRDREGERLIDNQNSFMLQLSFRAIVQDIYSR